MGRLAGKGTDKSLLWGIPRARGETWTDGSREQLVCQGAVETGRGSVPHAGVTGWDCGPPHIYLVGRQHLRGSHVGHWESTTPCTLVGSTRGTLPVGRGAPPGVCLRWPAVTREVAAVTLWLRPAAEPPQPWSGSRAPWPPALPPVPPPLVSCLAEQPASLPAPPGAPGFIHPDILRVCLVLLMKLVGWGVEGGKRNSALLVRAQGGVREEHMGGGGPREGRGREGSPRRPVSRWLLPGEVCVCFVI